MDLENQSIPVPPNSPVVSMTDEYNSKKMRMLFQFVSIFCLFALSVVLVIVKDEDRELKVVGIALISNLSGVLLGKLRVSK